VEVWLKNLTYAKHVWVDVHVLDEIGTVLHAETLTLRYERPAGDGGDLFVLDQVLYRGSVATEGSVDARPEARTVEYRVYGEMGGRVYTDGSDHRCDLRADSVSR
jgi:hypothetical protein